MKQNDLKYVLTLVLLLFIIILFKKIFIKEGNRNITTITEPLETTPISKSQNLSTNQPGLSINKVSLSSHIKKMLDEDTAALNYYQNILSQEQDKYSYTIKEGATKGSTKEATTTKLNEIQKKMIPIEKTINDYQQKISQDKLLILKNS